MIEIHSNALIIGRLKERNAQINRSIREPAEQLDHYEVLQIPESATLDEIRRAYKNQLLFFRNDRSGHYQVKQFNHVLEAYRTLSDVEKRASYNSGLAFTRSFENLCIALGKVNDIIRGQDANTINKIMLAGILSSLLEVSGVITALMYQESNFGSILCIIGAGLLAYAAFEALAHEKRTNARDKPLYQLGVVLATDYKRTEIAIAEVTPRLTYTGPAPSM